MSTFTNTVAATAAATEEEAPSADQDAGFTAEGAMTTNDHGTSGEQQREVEDVRYAADTITASEHSEPVNTDMAAVSAEAEADAGGGDNDGADAEEGESYQTSNQAQDQNQDQGQRSMQLEEGEPADDADTAAEGTAGASGIECDIMQH
jgi:hypothetical protein